LYKKIIHQSAIYFCGTIISVILGFFFKIFIVKHLGVLYLGTYSLGISFISIIMIFITLGYEDGLLFFVPKYLSKNNYARLHKYIQTTVRINIITIIIITGITLLFPSFISSQLLRTNEIEPYLFYFLVILIFDSFITILINLIKGFQEVHKTILIERFICNPFRILFCIMLINLGFGFPGFLIAEIFSSILAFILLVKSVYPLLKTINIPSIFSKSIININSEERSYSKNILLKNIFNRITLHFGKILILFYTDLKILGIYAILVSIVSFITIVHNSVISIFEPIISQLNAEKKVDTIGKYFQIITRYTFIFSLPIFGCLFLSKDIILNYLHISSDKVEIVFVLLVVMEFMKCAKGPVYISLQRMGYDKEIKNIVLFNLFITLTLFFILIPKYGLIGIGLAEILSITLSIILSSIILYKKSSIHIFHSKYLIHISVSIISFIIMNIFINDNNYSDSLYNLGLYILTAIVFLFLPNLLLIKEKEIKIFKSMFNL